MARFLSYGVMAASMAATAMFVPAFAAAPMTEAKPAAAKQCYDLGNIRSRMVIEPDSLLIEDAWGKYVLVKLGPPCRNIDELDRIGFEFDGSTQLCRKTDVKILHSRNTEAPLRCLIDTLTPLTKDEAKAYSTPKPK